MQEWFAGCYPLSLSNIHYIMAQRVKAMDVYTKKIVKELAQEWGVPIKMLRKSLGLRNDREYQKKYISLYRDQHPEETKAQRLKDWQSFKERNPERWREINREAKRRSREKKRLLEAARSGERRYL